MEKRENENDTFLFMEINRLKVALQLEKEQNMYLKKLLFPRDHEKNINRKKEIKKEELNIEQQQQQEHNPDEKMTLQLLLKQAEDKLEKKEKRLLFAEETICHLKAEKIQLIRQIESLKEAQQSALLVPIALPVEKEKKVFEDKKEKEKQLLQSRIQTLEKELEEWKTKSMENPSPSLLEKSEEEIEKEEEDLFEWKEQICNYPTPHFDLGSREVEYLLMNWTLNEEKRRVLYAWLCQVGGRGGGGSLVKQNMPLSIELPHLASTIRDGFLTLIIPLLRKRQTERHIQVHTRQSLSCRNQHEMDQWDLRIRIVDHHSQNLFLPPPY
jgi:hypothetical protein